MVQKPIHQLALVLIFRQTVEFLPGFYLLVVVGGLTLVFIPITLAHR